MTKPSTYLIKSKKRPISPLLVAVFGIGVYCWISQIYIGASILTVATIVILSSWHGVLIDARHNRIKKALLIFRIPFGEWKKISTIEYVSILKLKRAIKTYNVSSDLFSQSPTKGSIYAVNIITRNSVRKRIKLVTCDTFNEASKVGSELSDHLSVQMLDATSSNQNWIK